MIYCYYFKKLYLLITIYYRNNKSKMKMTKKIYNSKLILLKQLSNLMRERYLRLIYKMKIMSD